MATINQPELYPVAPKAKKEWKPKSKHYRDIAQSRPEPKEASSFETKSASRPDWHWRRGTVPACGAPSGEKTSVLPEFIGCPACRKLLSEAYKALMS